MDKQGCFETPRKRLGVGEGRNSIGQALCDAPGCGENTYVLIEPGVFTWLGGEGWFRQGGYRGPDKSLCPEHAP